MKISDKCSAEVVFKATVRMLATSSLTLVEDYSIKDDISNYKLLTHYISKNQLNKLRRDVRRAVRYLLALSKEPAPTRAELASWAELFNTWNKSITKYHIMHHNHQWTYYATALHYMIDSFYHIFKRFLIPSTIVGYRCNWCNHNLVLSWKELLNKILTDSVPNMYLYTSLAQAEHMDVDLLSLPTQSLEELRELGRFALTI